MQIVGFIVEVCGGSRSIVDKSVIVATARYRDSAVAIRGSQN